jgi:BirA family biotin operon repressor/biotin-[acetyl-CoA-carboxylase] ligase
LCSTILPAEVPRDVLPAVGFWASLAAQSAVLEVCSVKTGLKWPNDLLLGTLKCAGILCEAKSSGAMSRIVLGIGINVNRPFGVPEDLQAVAAWLSDATGRDVNRTSLMEALLGAYERSFDSLMSEPAAVIARWAAVAALDGKRVSVKAPDGSMLHEGEVLGVGGDGALLLRTEASDVRVMLGDVAAV